MRLGAQLLPPRPAPRPAARSASASSASGPMQRPRGRTARSRVCAPTSTLSSTLRLPNTRPCWNVRARPSAASRSAARPVIVCRANATLPASGDSSPVTRLNTVVLPAPFGPMMLTSSPCGDGEIERVDGGDAAEPARQSRDFEQRSHCASHACRTGPAAGSGSAAAARCRRSACGTRRRRGTAPAGSPAAPRRRCRRRCCRARRGSPWSAPAARRCDVKVSWFT